MVNQAVCDFFGYDAETLRTKTWRDLTLGDTHEQDLQAAEDVRSGRTTTYRVTKQYRRADGSPIWGTLSVSALRGPDDEFQNFVSQIIDVTAEVRGPRAVDPTRARERALAARLSNLTEHLMHEIASAAGYMASILPGELAGRIPVCSRHIASSTLAGDCFDYRWVDDDHLITYILDVSGHGIESAMVSISVHNLLRSGTLPTGTLLDPCRLLDTLNTLFQMDRQGGHYFTHLVRGVPGLGPDTALCQRRASAGPDVDRDFRRGRRRATRHRRDAGGHFRRHRLRLRNHRGAAVESAAAHSDGAYELPARRPAMDTGRLRGPDQPAGRVPGWSLATLIDHLRAQTAEGRFDDDCSLVLIELR